MLVLRTTPLRITLRPCRKLENPFELGQVGTPCLPLCFFGELSMKTSVLNKRRILAQNKIKDAAIALGPQIKVSPFLREKLVNDVVNARHRDSNLQSMFEIEAIAELMVALIDGPTYEEEIGRIEQEKADAVAAAMLGNDSESETPTQVSEPGMSDGVTVERVFSVDTPVDLFSSMGLFEAQVLALIQAGYSTYRSLEIATDQELLSVDGIGASSVTKIREYLDGFFDDPDPEAR